MSHIRTVSAFVAATVMLSGCAAGGATTALGRLSEPDDGIPCAPEEDDGCIDPTLFVEDDPSPVSLTETPNDAPVDADDGTTDFAVVTVTEPGSFQLPVPDRFAYWQAGDTSIEPLTSHVATWDAEWVDLGYLPNADAPAVGPLRAVVVAPVSFGEGTATFIIEFDSLPEGQSVKDWYLGDDSPQRVLPPADQTIASEFVDQNEDQALALFEFPDRLVSTVVTADREYGGVWRATMVLSGPVVAAGHDDRIGDLMAATIGRFQHGVDLGEVITGG